MFRIGRHPGRPEHPALSAGASSHSKRAHNDADRARTQRTSDRYWKARTRWQTAKGQTGTVVDSGFEVVSYDLIWPDRAAALIELLANIQGDGARRVEHIGSTAVAGMDAKDIVDVQVSVVDLESAVIDFDDGLRSVGFVRLPYEHDHVPAGRDDDADRWVKRMWARRNHPQGDVNLHVRLVGSPNERLALLFRDWLRAHPASVPAYAAFKRALAAAMPTVDVYTDIKDPVVDLVVTVAEEWAATTGWQIRSTSST